MDMKNRDKAVTVSEADSGQVAAGKVDRHEISSSSDDGCSPEVCFTGAKSADSLVTQEGHTSATSETSKGAISSTQGTNDSSRKSITHKACLVCGDRALGCNFNAVSCESCKAFFRRNAFKEIRGRCEGECEVTVESRSYCKRCRLAKCFKVGMNRDLILSDQQKQDRRKKILDNKYRREGVPNSENEMEHNESLHTSSKNNSAVESPSPVSHRMASEVDTSILEKLDDKSQEVIQEVIKAFLVSFDAPFDKFPDKEKPSAVEFLNMADVSVRRLVKMTRHLQVFQRLTQDDQIALLKGSVLEVLIIRSAKLFDPASISWKMQDPCGNDGGAKSISYEHASHENQEALKFALHYKKFATSLNKITHRDNIVLMLLIIMAVFSPDRPNVKNKDLVGEAQEMYAGILENYIKLQFTTEKQMFANLLMKLTDIRELNETHTSMILQMKVDSIEPLINEIFDLSFRG